MAFRYFQFHVFRRFHELCGSKNNRIQRQNTKYHNTPGVLIIASNYCSQINPKSNLVKTLRRGHTLLTEHAAILRTGNEDGNVYNDE